MSASKKPGLKTVPKYKIKKLAKDVKTSVKGKHLNQKYNTPVTYLRDAEYF